MTPFVCPSFVLTRFYSLSYLERSVRRVNFKADALQNVASSASVQKAAFVLKESLKDILAVFFIGALTSCIGAYNKIFLLEFDNGREAIARIPCALVGNVHLSTASEVATMEYVRDIIGHPTPRVLAWSSTPEARSTVGSDFILMERINGVALEKRWFNTLMKTLAPYYGKCCSSIYIFISGLFRRLVVCSSRRMSVRNCRAGRFI